MKLWQQLNARVETIFCNHKWRRLPHHFLPGEPFLMRCNKCLKMSKLDSYLTDKKQN